MEGLLQAVHTSYKTSEAYPEPALKPLKPVDLTLKQSSDLSKASSPSEALEILRNEPDVNLLRSTLKFLLSPKSNFDIRSPSPLAAQLVNVLISNIIPNYWGTFSHREKDVFLRERHGTSMSSSVLHLLLQSLLSVTGLNALLLKLKQLIQEYKDTKQGRGISSVSEGLRTVLQVLATLLGRHSTIEQLYRHVFKPVVSSRQKHVWQELLALLGGGKILGAAAEAEDIINELSKTIKDKIWLADGLSYSKWLGHNITHWLLGLANASHLTWNSCAELLSTSFRLGYSECILQIMLTSFLSEEDYESAAFVRLLGYFSVMEQRNILYAVVKLIYRDYLSSSMEIGNDSDWWQGDKSAVAGAAKVLRILLANEDSRQSHLVNWLCTPSGAGVGDLIAIRRTVVAALAGDVSCLVVILEKSMQQFGDQLYIRHTPTLQQDAHAQILLLSAGYMKRNSPLRLTHMLRSGAHLSVVSNRLASSSERARFLGMVIGEALSSLVDEGDKRMDFKNDDLKTPEAKWYKELVNVRDVVGNIQDLAPKHISELSKTRSPKATKPAAKKTLNSSDSKIISIEEVSDESEEEDLKSYAKPDSDPEDSDEDPTLVIRNKPQGPVYIRDLITYLRNTESYDHQKLAIGTAPSLIRRKANFGTEVSSHAEELASLLVGLQDKYDIDNFQDMRLQGMIAILVALPQSMGPWFSKTFFDGDYSISQRATILTVIGVGARELAGYGAEDSKLTTMKAIDTSFPSKSLPPTLHNLYTISSAPINRLTSSLTASMLGPLAAQTADSLTGPAILKTRTFSSRLTSKANRTKTITNALSAILASSFFHPLTARFHTHTLSRGTSPNQNIAYSPHLLALFIKTLSLLLHAAGPSTLPLPQMSHEYWDLLLALRTQGEREMIVREAVLTGLLTVLECNSAGDGGRALVERQGRELLETGQWVQGVLAQLGLGGASGGEEERCRMLAAAVLVRIGEVEEKYKALLMGDLASFGGR